MHKYYNLKETLSGKPNLVTMDQLSALTLNPNKDYYLSIFKYSEDQKKIAEKSGSVKSIKDVVTSTLVWDFDSEKDIDKARKDTLELGKRLVENYNIDPDIIYCYSSGNKGFHVVVPINKEINPDQFKQAITTIAKGLETFDTTVSDHARILRLEHTKHPKSGLYKIPLHLAEIEELTTDKIKELAKTDRDESLAGFKEGTAMLPEKLFALPEKKKEASKKLDDDSVLLNPPKGWKPYKWALAQGIFDNGERHQALMVIAATCRSLGYDKESTYYICKSALKKQSARTGQEEFSKEELWNNIIEESVFSDRWEGGSYSPHNNPWLKSYCDKNGYETEEKEEPPCIGLDFLTDQFTNYATNFEHNIIKTGINGLDDNVIFSTSTLNGILGQPGSGKCLGKNTPIIMFDGTIKMVQDIKTGDLLMGDDSKPRTVLSTTSGVDNLYKVKQTNGDDYIINSVHILSLKGSSSDSNDKYSHDNVIDIEIGDYLKESSNFKKRFKGFKVPVEFNTKEQHIDSYVLGYWLGNGSSSGSQFTINKKHTDVINTLDKYFEKNGNIRGKVIDEENHYEIYYKAHDNSERNFFLEFLQKSNLINNKHIPHEFLTGDKQQRLALLSGLIDSDGHYDSDKDLYEITFKNTHLSEQVVFLCRSLGLKTTINKTVKSCPTANGTFTGEYNRIHIMYDNLELPVKVEYKTPKNLPKQRWYDLTEIEIESIGVGEYFGFEIDGNHRFLLGDFTVTHNTTMALNYLRNTSLAGIPSMFFSLDMGAPLVYAKLVQKATGYTFKKALELYRTNPKERERISNIIKTEYKNVGFNFKAGLTVTDMLNAINKQTEQTGIKPKLIVIDYLENIAGPYSDATANAGLIANQLKDLANETETCVTLLLQTQKHSTPDVSDPLLSMKQIKGSSVIEQACSTVLTLWREGYSPNTVDDDKYISFAIVKNRFGSLWQGDFSWEPIRGDIKSLSDEQYEDLQSFRKRKKEQKQKDAQENSSWS
jgi:replicative DNA helicase